MGIIPEKTEPNKKEEEKNLNQMKTKKKSKQEQTNKSKKRIQYADITDWIPWDRDSQIRINPNNPKEYINTESGRLYKNGERKNVSKNMKAVKTSKAVQKSPDKVKVNFVQPEAEELEEVVTSKRASR